MAPSPAHGWQSIRIGPVLGGAVVAVVGGLVVGAAYVTALLDLAVAEGTTPEALVSEGPHLAIIEFLIGPSLTLTGGFLAAHHARARYALHGGAVGMTALATWLVFAVAGDSESLWTPATLLSALADLPAGFAGGYTAGRLARRRTAVQSERGRDTAV